MSRRRTGQRLLLALLVVGAGRLAAPSGPPVYDGIGAPDEPYRYVSAPAGAPRTAPPTSARADSPLVGGRSAAGITVSTGESGPQLSLYLPPQALVAPGARITVTVTPLAPTDSPPGARVDGNVYDIRGQAAGPVTLSPQAALATLYLRSTSARQPGPTMYRRASPTAPWQALRTARGGQDIYVAAFTGFGEYALARSGAPSPRGGHGTSPVPWLVGGGLVLLVVVVVVVRLRAAE